MIARLFFVFCPAGLSYWAIAGPCELILAAAACYFWNPPYRCPLETIGVSSSSVRVQQRRSYVEEHYQAGSFDAWAAIRRALHPELRLRDDAPRVRESALTSAIRKSQAWIILPGRIHSVFAPNWDPPVSLHSNEAGERIWRQFYFLRA